MKIHGKLFQNNVSSNVHLLHGVALNGKVNKRFGFERASQQMMASSFGRLDDVTGRRTINGEEFRPAAHKLPTTLENTELQKLNDPR